jgi:hypothetical protein
MGKHIWTMPGNTVATLGTHICLPIRKISLGEYPPYSSNNIKGCPLNPFWTLETASVLTVTVPHYFIPASRLPAQNEMLDASWL